MFMGNKSRWSRLLTVPALVIASLLVATAPAYEAVERCIADSESESVNIVPGTGGGQQTRAVAAAGSQHLGRPRMGRPCIHLPADHDL
jgi:hypothetical protein